LKKIRIALFLSLHIQASLGARSCLLRQWLFLLRTASRLGVASEAGVHRRAFAFGGGPGRYALIQRFSKINISLTIESIAK